jgi:hypothetical protein
VSPYLPIYHGDLGLLASLFKRSDAQKMGGNTAVRPLAYVCGLAQKLEVVQVTAIVS